MQKQIKEGIQLYRELKKKLILLIGELMDSYCVFSLINAT